MSNTAKSFGTLAINLNVLHNYFEYSLTKLFSYLYLAKFLDTLEKLFFPYNISINNRIIISLNL